MGLTYLEAAREVTSKKKLAVIRELVEEDILKVMPFENVEGGGVFYNQEIELPGVGWRGVNEGLDESYGMLNPQAEPVKIYGGDVNIDRFILDTQGRAKKGQAVESKVRALRHNFADCVINGGLPRGDEPSNPREMDGLRKRIPSLSSQLLSNSANGAGLSLGALDELIDAVEDGGRGKSLLMNKTMRRLLSACARNPILAGNINFTKDEFGYQYMEYSNARIVIMDVNSQNKQIIPFAEGADVDECSIYCVAFGEDMLTGIQGSVDGAYGISVRDLGESHAAPADVTRIEWYPGMAVYHGKSAARLSGITKSAVTA